ncbi:Fe-S cluster assembly sulfur transfer protein SufU [Aquicella lusitana]|uniref:Fe-S cluster assembly protein SufU n=1 Tax=Aquicella lusitana TaxID=254246 RepID=A0A370GC30_9COXI|nr:SUF system NifU family Fe-S cluster assembly protein [Aquicella lusitana]RDI41338.1 Fe-S cluster assembly protein SufU [Aquicella lusitana]VVC72296.1 Zinc-dependent sulfurtransferase SufU [Aquicella lusitana]
MSLRELYQEIIVDHGKAPRNFGKLSHASHCKAGHNPLCGDKLTLYLLERDGVVQDICFEGAGCAISVASASLMTECVKGKKRSDVIKLFEQFHDLVTAGKTSEEDLGKLAVFSGVAEFPVRVKCATLAWHTLKAALEQDPDPVSTE